MHTITARPKETCNYGNSRKDPSGRSNPADVLDELSFDARVQPNEVGVIVKDGVVTLTGWLDSYPMRQWPISCPGLDPRK
jgi:osmotically-inducible protein OsmY